MASQCRARLLFELAGCKLRGFACIGGAGIGALRPCRVWAATHRSSSGGATPWTRRAELRCERRWSCRSRAKSSVGRGCVPSAGMPWQAGCELVIASVDLGQGVPEGIMLELHSSLLATVYGRGGSPSLVLGASRHQHVAGMVRGMIWIQVSQRARLEFRCW